MRYATAICYCIIASLKSITVYPSSTGFSVLAWKGGVLSVHPVNNELNEWSKNNDITSISVGVGKSDDDTADNVLVSEVNEPPRKCLCVLRARMRIQVTVSSGACRYVCTDLNSVFPERQAACKTRIHSPWRIRSHSSWSGAFFCKCAKEANWVL